MAKNEKGEIVPYHTKGFQHVCLSQLEISEGVSWIDGSFFHDLPKQKIAEMFNVNHFLVSQVKEKESNFIMSL